MIWDEDGQMLTATFADYLKNTAADTPDIEVGHLEYPSPFTATGSKAVGEGPTIPVFPAIANAVEDALSDFRREDNRPPPHPVQGLVPDQGEPREAVAELSPPRA